MFRVDFINTNNTWAVKLFNSRKQAEKFGKTLGKRYFEISEIPTFTPEIIVHEL